MSDGDPFYSGRVTVVLPTYNRSELLPRAIESALAQTAVNQCDVVVVDDGSTDATPTVAARYKGRIIYIRRPNGGLAVARNTAIRAHPNEFVAFLDDDDLWESDKIERQLQALRRWPKVALVGGRTVDCYPDGCEAPHPIPPIPLDRPADFAQHMLEGTFLPPSSVMVRGRALFAAGLFHPRLRWAEDFLAFTRLACRAPGVYLDAPVARYFVSTPGALSNNAAAMQIHQLRGRYLLRRELRQRPDCCENWERGLARSFTDLRDLAYRQGRFAAAARWGLCSLLHRPWGRARWEWARFLEAAFRATLGSGRGVNERAVAKPLTGARRLNTSALRADPLYAQNPWLVRSR